jgi:hypothetical protein
LELVIIQTRKPQLKTLLQSQEAIIIALTKGAGTCKIIADDREVPQGCGTVVVTGDIIVHVPVEVGALSRIFFGFADPVNRARSMRSLSSTSWRRKLHWRNPTRTN